MDAYSNLETDIEAFDSLVEKFGVGLEYATPVMNDMICAICGRLLLVAYENSDSTHECRLCRKCFHRIIWPTIECPEHQTQQLIKHEMVAIVILENLNTVIAICPYKCGNLYTIRKLPNHVHHNCKYRPKDEREFSRKEFNIEQKPALNFEEKKKTKLSYEVWEKIPKEILNEKYTEIAEPEKCIQKQESTEKPLIEFDEPKQPENNKKIAAKENPEKSLIVLDGLMESENNTKIVAKEEYATTTYNDTMVAGHSYEQFPLHPGPLSDQLTGHASHRGLVPTNMGSEVKMYESYSQNQIVPAHSQGSYHNSNDQLKEGYAGLTPKKESQACFNLKINEMDFSNQHVPAQNQDSYHNSNDQLKKGNYGLIPKKVGQIDFNPKTNETDSGNQQIAVPSKGLYNRNDQSKAGRTEVVPQKECNNLRRTSSVPIACLVNKGEKHMATSSLMSQDQGKTTSDQLNADHTELKSQNKISHFQNYPTTRWKTKEVKSWPGNLVSKMVTQFENQNQDIGVPNKSSGNSSKPPSVASRVFTNEELAYANLPVNKKIANVHVFGLGDGDHS